MQKDFKGSDLFTIHSNETEPTPLLKHERGHIWGMDEPIDSDFLSASISCTLQSKVPSKNFELTVEKPLELDADFLWPICQVDNTPLFCRASVARNLIVDFTPTELIAPRLTFKSNVLKKKLTDKLSEFMILSTGSTYSLDENLTTTSRFEGAIAYEGLAGYEFTENVHEGRSVVLRIPRKQGEGYVISLNDGNLPDLFWVKQTNVLCCSDRFRQRCIENRLGNIDFLELGVFV